MRLDINPHLRTQCHPRATFSALGVNEGRVMRCTKSCERNSLIGVQRRPALLLVGGRGYPVEAIRGTPSYYLVSTKS